jgi:hypothetical protein
MKKRAFVPAADCLESRIALSGVAMRNGLPFLSVHALQQTYHDINRAFTTFANKGQNYNVLFANLTNSLRRIPFQVRDGLQAAVQQEPGFLQDDIASGVANPVKTEYAATIADVNSFVGSETQAGIFIYG